MPTGPYVEGSQATREAGADLSAKQYFIVKLNSSNQVVLAAAGTDALFGVLMNKPESGDTADVRLRTAAGTAKVKAGGAITLGAAITSDANGEAVVTTTDGDHVLGFAAEAADDGDVFEFTPSNSRLYIA